MIQIGIEFNESAAVWRRDAEAILSDVCILMELHKAGMLGGEVMPEDALVGHVPKEALPEVITLGMSLNFQRNSYRLWESVAATYVDSATRWIFDVDRVAHASLDDLRASLLQYKVGLQPNKHTEIWSRVASGIHRHGECSVVKLVESCERDIVRLRSRVQGDLKKDFPYLSGPKIFNYWLYVMEQYCDVKWLSRDEISIAPDTHVLQGSVRLGLVSSDVLDGSAQSRELVSNAWKELLAQQSFAVIDVHTPLWLWSRAGLPALERLSIRVDSWDN